MCGRPHPAPQSATRMGSTGLLVLARVLVLVLALVLALALVPVLAFTARAATSRCRSRFDHKLCACTLCTHDVESIVGATPATQSTRTLTRVLAQRSPACKPRHQQRHRCGAQTRGQRAHTRLAPPVPGAGSWHRRQQHGARLSSRYVVVVPFLGSCVHV